MITGDYRCPYCQEVCNEQGIKGHIMQQHKGLYKEFKFKHLNKFPLGHKLHVEEQEKIDEYLKFKDVLQIEEIEKGTQVIETELSEEEELEKNELLEPYDGEEKQKLTKEELLGITQTEKKSEPITPQVLLFECGNCGATVKQGDAVCKNCGAPLNWHEVE